MAKKNKVVRRSQEPISKEEMHIFLNYVLSGHVEDDKHAEQLRRLARRTTTLSDVTVVAQTLNTMADQKIVQLMEAIQIQSKVLEKLGATDEMFEQAKEEYKEEIEKLRKELEEKSKELEESSKEKEEDNNGEHGKGK